MKTKKFLKVLIALDYDPTAKKVAETGYLLAKSIGAEVVLIHVIADYSYYFAANEFSPIMGANGFINTAQFELNGEEGLLKASHMFLDKSKEHLGDDSIKTYVKKGEYAETILDAAKELHADIIVMGSHSKKWLENILVGSVTEKVLHHSKIPLFIVPTKKHK